MLVKEWRQKLKLKIDAKLKKNGGKLSASLIEEANDELHMEINEEDDFFYSRLEITQTSIEFKFFNEKLSTVRLFHVKPIYKADKRKTNGFGNKVEQVEIRILPINYGKYTVQTEFLSEVDLTDVDQILEAECSIANIKAMKLQWLELKDMMEELEKNAEELRYSAQSSAYNRETKQELSKWFDEVEA